MALTIMIPEQESKRIPFYNAYFERTGKVRRSKVVEDDDHDLNPCEEAMENDLMQIANDIRYQIESISPMLLYVMDRTAGNAKSQKDKKIIKEKDQSNLLSAALVLLPLCTDEPIDQVDLIVDTAPQTSGLQPKQRDTIKKMLAKLWPIGKGLYQMGVADGTWQEPDGAGKDLHRDPMSVPEADDADPQRTVKPKRKVVEDRDDEIPY